MKNRKKPFLLLLLLIFMSFLLASCKSTPAVNAVINKNEGILEEKLKEEYEVEQIIGFPDHIEEEIYSKSGEYSIYVNADITVPSQSSYSVLSIVPDNFTQDEVNKFINYFIGDRPLYEESYILTKDMIKERIIQIKAEMIALDKNSDDMVAAENHIKKLEEQYNSAPESVKRTEVSSALIDEPELGCEILWAYSDLGYDELSRIEVTNLDYAQVISLCLDRSRYFLNNALLTGKTAESQRMMPEEAKQEAVKVISELGIEDMIPAKVDTGITEDQSKQGYIVTFRRSVNGVPVALNQILDYSEHMDMAAQWPSDKLQVRIDDKGISAFYWDYKGKVLEELTSNVKILSFEGMYQIAKQQLKNKFSWIETNDCNLNYERTVHVDRIVLEYTCAQEKDKPGYYLLVPAWNFYGGNTLKFENGQTEEEQGLRADICVLSLNAVDGSVIGG